MNAHDPYVKCPCGFEARTVNAENLFKAHRCQKPPLNWQAVAVFLGFFFMVGLIVEMVVAP